MVCCIQQKRNLDTSSLWSSKFGSAHAFVFHLAIFFIYLLIITLPVPQGTRKAMTHLHGSSLFLLFIKSAARTAFPSVPHGLLYPQRVPLVLRQLLCLLLGLVVQLHGREGQVFSTVMCWYKLNCWNTMLLVSRTSFVLFLLVSSCPSM